MATHLSRLDNGFGRWVKEMTVESSFAVLSRQQLNSNALKDFQQRIEREIYKDRRELDFQAERFWAYDMIQRVFTDNGRGNGFLIPRKAVEVIEQSIVVLITPSEDDFEQMYLERYLGFVWIAMVGPDRRKTVEIVDEYFDYADGVKSLSLKQLHENGIDSKAYFEKKIKHEFIKDILPDISYTLQSFKIYQNKEAALLTTIAILRYEKDKNRLPASLDELISAGYLKEMPMDTCSDKPLVYKKTDGGFLLYSVGLDFKDDGGEVYRYDKGRVRRWADKGDTVFWPMEK